MIIRFLGKQRLNKFCASLIFCVNKNVLLLRLFVIDNLLKVSRWQNQKVVEEFFDGSRIIEIPHSDRVGMAMFKRLSALMNRDLGHDDPTNQPLTLHSNPDLPSYIRIFVFVEEAKKLAVGCCLAEELTAESVGRNGYHVHRLVGGKSALISWRMQTNSGIENTDIKDTSSMPRTSIDSFPLCGIRRLWVSAKFRRKRIASTLLTCVTQNLMYLTHFDRTRVAFAEPTADGAEFASKFTGEEDFLIY